MKKRLFLDRVALSASGVSPGNVKRATAVIADFADAGLAFGDGAAMSTGKAADTIIAQIFVQIRVGFADSLVEDVLEGWHEITSILAPL